MTANLTRDEAAARSAIITVASYHVDLDLTGGDEVFGSASVIRFDCVAPGSASFINLTAPAPQDITLQYATADGTATRKLRTEKTIPAYIEMPARNM